MKLFKIEIGIEEGAWREHMYGKAKTIKHALSAATRAAEKFKTEVDEPKVISIEEIGILSF